MINNTHGFSLLEFIISSSILIVGLGLGLAGAHGFAQSHYARLNMRQLHQSLYYARSLAINQRQKVTICPSYNRHSCSGSWNNGLLVRSANGDFKYFKLYKNTEWMLSLQQSGYSNNSVEVHPNGMTNTNGHFNYKSLNSRYIPQFNLYFNKALRVYVTRRRY